MKHLTIMWETLEGRDYTRIEASQEEVLRIKDVLLEALKEEVRYKEFENG